MNFTIFSDFSKLTFCSSLVLLKIREIKTHLDEDMSGFGLKRLFINVEVTTIPGKLNTYLKLIIYEEENYIKITAS